MLELGSYEVNPPSGDFQFFTMNGRCYPLTTPLPVQCGERVRIRLANPAMMEHPIHLYGQQFMVTAVEGNRPFHCHMPHHTANNMTKELGGMFTVVQYR